MNKTLDQVLKEIKKEILPEIKLKEPIIYYNSKGKYLAKYLGFNYSDNKRIDKPIIRLNCAECLRSVKKNLSLYDVLLTTVLHELGHALQEIKGKPFDENEAENFAYNYWNFGQITEI